MTQTRSIARGLAVVGGGAMVVAGLVLSLFVAFIGMLAAQAPNPYIPSGDPCCGTPDTWGEVVSGVALTTVLAFALGLLLAVAVALVWWGARARMLPRRTVALWIPASMAGVALLAMGIALFAQREQVHLAPDCQEFTFRRAEWRSRDPGVWQHVALGLGDCRVLDGQTKAEVRAALGAPDFRRTFPRNRYGPETTKWAWRGALYVDFERGRATDVSSDLFSE